MDVDQILFDNVDAIVMLTWSNWFTELRSNRYHYAVRFAKEFPVIFVQPDLPEPRFEFEETGIPNIKILHLYKQYDADQANLFNQALLGSKVIRPIFWIYNAFFENIICNNYSVLNIYHGTEDYLSSESRLKIKDNSLLKSFNNILASCNSLIAVSDGVRDSFLKSSNFMGSTCTITNGCDYSFYSPIINNISPSVRCEENVVFYQGNIFDKLDYDLLHELAERMPQWVFNFCGKVLFNEPGWEKLCTLSNVTYLGLLTPEELREQCYKSTVGIIPFVQSEWLIDRSFPLKTFEYLACGLPVVTIPIKSLLSFSEVLLFANDVCEFEEAIKKGAKLRFDDAHFKMRLDFASQQNYDLKFLDAKRFIANEIINKREALLPLRIVILYEPSSINVSTISEHLNSFKLFSKHEIFYLPATQNSECEADLSIFDVVVVHYSIRLSVYEGALTLSSSYVNAIQEYGGYKILFIQDEYEGTEIARSWILNLGIHTVYTCVPKNHIEDIYPRERFPYVEFINTLTGYVPMKIASLTHKATSERSVLIGYRGRALPYWYGSLGQEKLNIGKVTKEICLQKGMNIDIEWEESKRVYGDDWYKFLGGCRATLGTESGSNVFDFDGTVRSRIEEKLKENACLLYDDISAEYVMPYETIKMNQISPKVFEAIALRTALILFEGDYSGVLIPNVHYISLKKDFSNINDVLIKLQDNSYVNELTERAYMDIINSKKYSYEQFINTFDSQISRIWGKNRASKHYINSFIGYLDEHGIIRNFSVKKCVNRPSNTAFTKEQIELSEQMDLHEHNTQQFSTSYLLFNLLKIFVKFLQANLPNPVKKVIRFCVPFETKNYVKRKLKLI